MVLGIVLAVLVLLCGLYLFCIMPNRGRRNGMKPFEDKYIAHRGLFDNKGDAPENSLAAFAKAAEHGYGIELDVQLTKDGKLVVFHDESLKRMCRADLVLHTCTFEELQAYTLADSQERIPLFSDVLEVIGGRVPLVVEIKYEGDWLATTAAAAEMLDRYQGIYCMESFHPGAVEWYRKNRPEIIRGQLSMDYFKHGEKQPWLVKLLLTNLMMNFRSRPDFIAYDHTQADQLSYRICRSLFPVENVAWTIKSQAELEAARSTFQCFIFDSFIPEEKQ